MNRRTSLSRAALAAVVTAGLAGAAHGFALRGGVLGNGATPAAGAAASGRRMFATTGQPVVGTSLGPNHTVSHGFWSFGGSRVIAVGDPGFSDRPDRLELGAPYPNPTAGTLRVRLALPRSCRVDATILDVQGRAVATLVDRELPAGFHTLEWRDASRATGVYFARVAIDGAVLGTRRFVVMR